MSKQTRSAKSSRAMASAPEGSTSEPWPTLGDLVHVEDARSIIVHDVSTGMNDDSPISAVYELRRDERNGLVGDVRFSRRQELRHTQTVKLGTAKASSFLELLAHATMIPGAYQPRLEHTDDFPSIEVAIHVGECSPVNGGRFPS